jgi:hypothetical protein
MRNHRSRRGVHHVWPKRCAWPEHDRTHKRKECAEAGAVGCAPILPIVSLRRDSSSSSFTLRSSMAFSFSAFLSTSSCGGFSFFLKYSPISFLVRFTFLLATSRSPRAETAAARARGAVRQSTRQSRRSVGALRLRTLPPLRVGLDDLVDERDVGIATLLRLANEVGVAALVRAEEKDVEHWSRAAKGLGVSRSDVSGVRSW